MSHTPTAALLRLTSSLPFSRHADSTFASRFPFSFFLHSKMERLRPVVEAAAKGSGGESLGQALLQQARLLDVTTPAEELGASLLRDYVYDFTCMSTPQSSTVSRESQASMTLTSPAHICHVSHAPHRQPALLLT